ncbi:hypothetical protein DFH05DRAFT_1487420 [Lentinula detonsa]|uniref:Protein kinase domain-containing protein n=1 Tax=Lentinula detonsa TaxID=2804962 RepID=A0A9W8P1X6_9AGAR|nr:hypothetical protein DFH05DRAFT_1487420 [Lentinula detonsa]
MALKIILILGSLILMSCAREPSWLGKYIIQTLTVQDKRILTTTLDLKLGSLISDVGNTGEVKQVINFQGIPRNDLVAKIFYSHVEPNLVYAEVKALKQIGEFHAAGYHDESIVILMEKKPGEMIADTVQWKQAAYPKRSYFLREAKQKYCEKVAKIATTKKVYHGDDNDGNFLVQFDNTTDTICSVEVIDWGVALFVNEPVPNEKEVYQYCIH